jgi:methionyl-tRNA formyltransferase
VLNVIAASRKGYENLSKRLEAETGESFVLITNPEELTQDRLEQLAPRYVFLPHWSHIIPAAVHERFECVIFHMTDLPFGRGGSPLQNLISRGIYQTQMTALRCVDELDAGPVYLKRPFKLDGRAEEIYRRAADVIEAMIAEILRNRPEPVEQIGEPTCFRRRKPQQSNLAEIETLVGAYDHIRMLDAEGYPRAFLETHDLRFEFDQATRNDGRLVAQVTIYEKDK